MIRSRRKVRLFVPSPLSEGVELALGHDQTHYLLRVMRLGPGDEVLVFNGRNGEWLTGISQVTKNRCVLMVKKAVRSQIGEPDICLAFCPVKKARLDFLVEKATELGVSELQPVLTRRTEVSRINEQRLTAIAREAAEQCERLSVPLIGKPATLDTFIGDWNPAHILAYMDESGRGLPMNMTMTQAFRSGAHHDGHDDMNDGVCDGGKAGLLVGPEGGFTTSELDRLRDLPFSVPITLGPRILRAETAALAALANWQILFGDGCETRLR